METLPTLTDANVVLGYLSPTAIAGGRVAIHPELAQSALDAVATPLQLPVMETARGAYEIAVSNMTKAVKAVTSERGRDPRDSVMVAFGGAGPLYGAALAQELGIGTVLVPVHTGVFSSLGLLVADSQAEVVAPMADTADTSLMAQQFEQLEVEATARLSADGVDEATTLQRLLDMRYRGQRFELRVVAPAGDFDDHAFALARKLFHESHLRTYGRAGEDDLVEVVNLRVRATRPNPTPFTDVLRISEDTTAEFCRLCWFDGPVQTPVVTRSSLSSTPRPGPLIVEEMDSTTLVPPGATAHRDALNNIVITWTPKEQHR